MWPSSKRTWVMTKQSRLALMLLRVVEMVCTDGVGWCGAVVQHNLISVENRNQRARSAIMSTCELCQSEIRQPRATALGETEARATAFFHGMHALSTN